MGTQQNRREGVVTTKMQQEFSALVKKPIDDQSKFFLNRYMEEFEGKFSEVLEMSETFRKIAASDKDDENVSELNEVEFLRFLTTQGRTMTRDQMRKTFASVDFDKSGGVSFIEWLCFRYEKTVDDLMTPQDPLPADLRAELDAAMAEERVFTDKIAELEALVEKGGVKGNTAKAELEALKNKYSGEKVRLEKIKLAAEKKRRNSQQNVARFAAEHEAEKQAKVKEELQAKEKAEKAKAEQEAADRAAEKKALQSQWEGK